MAVVQTGIPGVESDGFGALKVTEQATILIGQAPASTLVGITSAEAVAANTSRKGLVLLNLSKKIISLGLDGEVALLNKGITLLSGGVWTMDKATFTLGSINAISDAAGSLLSIQEFE